MPQAAILADPQHLGRYRLGDFLADIAGIAATADPVDLKRGSRDYF